MSSCTRWTPSPHGACPLQQCLLSWCKRSFLMSLPRTCVSVQLLFGEHPFEKPADVEEGSVKRTLHRILKVTRDCIAMQTWCTQGHSMGSLLIAIADTLSATWYHATQHWLHCTLQSCDCLMKVACQVVDAGRVLCHSHVHEQFGLLQGTEC